MFAMAPLLFSNPLFEHDIWGYSVLNFSAFALIFIALALYLKILPQSISRPILSRDHNFWDPSHFRFAAFALLIAFPLVIFFNESLSILICYCFKITELPDQAAVRFLKATLEYPILTILTMFTIVILGPIIEEILFRGFLQSWIRQHLGPQKAICITSVLFSFFHYSYDQGLANIPIIGSLCIFAYFLGFVYEKKGSLIAPITLHALFNGCNVLSLYLLGSS
jgi:membrane protease YdiL (CAAX protease family)